MNEINAKNSLSNVEAPEMNGSMLGADDVPSGTPVELSGKVMNTDTLDMMHTTAAENSSNAKADGISIAVSDMDVLEFDSGDSLKYFTIVDNHDRSGANDYAVYQIYDKVYYRPLKEFVQLKQDSQDHIPGISIVSFKNRYDNIRKPLDTSYSIVDRDDCAFVICSIFSSITGKSYDNSLIIDNYVDESCKVIKRTKLGTDGEFDKSVAAHNAKYGTPDQNAFKREIEDKQKQDGTVGALDQQQQQESVRPVLPNVHRKMMSEQICGVDIDAIFEAKAEDIYYEPHDRVLVKTSSGEVPGMVTDVYDSLDFGQLLTVMCQGHTLNVTTKDVAPDMNYLVNQLADYTDEFADIAFQLDKKTRLNKRVENDKKDYTKDYSNLNDVMIGCDIVSNGFKVNFEPMKVSLKDIAECSKYVKVVNESGVADIWPIQNVEISEDRIQKP